MTNYDMIHSRSHYKQYCHCKLKIILTMIISNNYTNYIDFINNQLMRFY